MVMAGVLGHRGPPAGTQTCHSTPYRFGSRRSKHLKTSVIYFNVHHGERSEQTSTSQNCFERRKVLTSINKMWRHATDGPPRAEAVVTREGHRGLPREKEIRNTWVVGKGGRNAHILFYVSHGGLQTRSWVTAASVLQRGHRGLGQTLPCLNVTVSSLRPALLD